MSPDQLLSLFVQYGYVIVFVTILLDNAGLPIPGELLLVLFGALARNGELNFAGGLAVAAAAALAGDSFGYWLGRLTGDRMLRAYCRLTLGSGACVSRAVAYYRHHGKATAIVGRFAMGVRAFLPSLAGSARMPYHRFLLADGLGAVLWSAVFLLAGYSVGWRLEEVKQGYRAGSRVLIGTLAVSFALYLLVKLVRRWRHGSATLRERAVARVTAALRASGNRPAASPPSASSKPGLLRSTWAP